MFSKKPEQADRPLAPSRGDRGMGKAGSKAGGSTFSVIGGDVTITGDLAATSELHVDGRIEGDIACAALVQGEGSVIEGAVSAESARLAGTLKGSVAARELVILKSAQIDGDVQYETLTIEQGAVVEGRFAPKGVGHGGVGHGGVGHGGVAHGDTHAAPGDADMTAGSEPKLTLAT